MFVGCVHTSYELTKILVLLRTLKVARAQSFLTLFAPRVNVMCIQWIFTTDVRKELKHTCGCLVFANHVTTHVTFLIWYAIWLYVWGPCVDFRKFMYVSLRREVLGSPGGGFRKFVGRATEWNFMCYFFQEWCVWVSHVYLTQNKFWMLWVLNDNV